MISLGVKSTIDKVAKQFDRSMGRQIPFAISLAMNRSAQLARQSLAVALRVTFDRPTPYTLNSLYTKAASKTNLQVTIGHKSDPSKLTASRYLRAEIEGGNRSRKSTEKVAGFYLVPTKLAKLDSYGNIPAATLKLIREAAQRGSVRTSTKTYVAIMPGNKQGLVPGVYERVAQKTKITTRGRGENKRKEALAGGTTLRPIVFFQSQVSYRATYDLTGTVWRTFNAEFGKQFAAAMDFAIGSAKIRA